MGADGIEMEGTVQRIAATEDSAQVKLGIAIPGAGVVAAARECVQHGCGSESTRGRRGPTSVHRRPGACPGPTGGVVTALAILGGLILGICLAECVRAYRNAHEGHAMEAVITAAPDPREELDPNRFDWLAESWSAHRESCPQPKEGTCSRPMT